MKLEDLAQTPPPARLECPQCGSEMVLTIIDLEHEMAIGYLCDCFPGQSVFMGEQVVAMRSKDRTAALLVGVQQNEDPLPPDDNYPMLPL